MSDLDFKTATVICRFFNYYYLQDKGEIMKIQNLIQEVNDSLEKEERNATQETAPDEDWLEGTNARLPEVS